MPQRLAWCLVIAVILVAGCSAGKARPAPGLSGAPPLDATAITSDMSWWVCRFRVAWPEDSEPDQAVDLLLAHAVAGPALKSHATRVPWWRFHRRAARDGAGHRFSLLFYATPDTAGAIFESIQANPALVEAVEAGVIEQVLLPDRSMAGLDAVADTSDPAWSPELQHNWPSYIMGVSAMWLGLIDDLITTTFTNPATFDELLAAYRDTDDRITEMWNREGQHALLHHLSAVFGYEPIRIRKEIVF